MTLLEEIKRHKIFQVAFVYAVVAWLLVQIAVSVEEPLRLPDWADTLVIVLLALASNAFDDDVLREPVLAEIRQRLRVSMGVTEVPWH